MMLSRKALAGYDRLLAGACGVASSQFQTLMLLWLADNPGADPDDLRREAMRVALDVLPASGDAAAQVAHRLCVALASQESEDAGRVKVGVSYEPDVDALDEAFRRAPSADPLGSMASAVADDVHRGANEQMGVSAEALGATGLALVPVGDIRTCEFCVARAAEGFHLPKRGSKTLAKSHDHCRCKVVPGFGADPRVEGHDVAFYRGLHALAGDLAHRGYSHRQIRDAMAGTPVDELGPPNSGVGGRPRSEGGPGPEKRIPRGTGAKRGDVLYIELPDGETAPFLADPIDGDGPFAGYGTDKPLRKRFVLADLVGGTEPDLWSHDEVHGWVEDPSTGEERFVNVHLFSYPDPDIEDFDPRFKGWSTRAGESKVSGQ